ncbi:hypothetical protein K466DRAFT_584175 [Polyporus arcularius HHB13444]|uniref:Uncharacterized protein n=1 Tax=Polyporus arcularius HHB13444 TaxID=1314778 RepID=A0A5C3PUW2_9APHY|nr:hypothetical protein K466DRAFT_584175 [Polyporus arcularius HHB13444]
MLDHGDEFLATRMIRYGMSLRGTRAYWLARRAELVDMIRVQGSPHLRMMPAQPVDSVASLSIEIPT